MKTVMLALSLGWLCVAGDAQPPALRRPDYFPPKRGQFDVQVPGSFGVGRLWWDVGLFHPFTGSISRAEWDQRFFPLVNRAAEGSLSAEATRLLVADALGSLEDPVCMALDPGEGDGRHFAPLIWEKRGSDLWIIGGAEDQIKASFGPVAAIDGVPLKDFLARHVGSRPNPEQVVAAAQATTRRVNPFSVRITDANGRTLDVKSVDSLPKEVWIEGGKRGDWIHELPAFAEGPRVDCRTAHWLEATGVSEGLKKRVQILAHKQSKALPINRVVRSNIGYSRHAVGQGASFRDYPYSQTVLSEPLQGPTDLDGLRHYKKYASKMAPVQYEFTFPQVIGPALAGLLAGWGLPADANAPGDTEHWTVVEGIDARIRTVSYCEKIDPTATHETPLSIDGSKRLTRDGARLLAASTLVNYDHLFGFTERFADQAAVVRWAVKAYNEGLSVQWILGGAIRWTKDAHSTDIMSGKSHYRDYQDRGGVGVPPFEAELDAKGRLVVIRSASPLLETGSRITKINGSPIDSALAQMRTFTPERPEDRSSWIWEGLGYFAIDHPDFQVEMVHRNGKMETLPLQPIPPRSVFLPTKVSRPAIRVFTSDHPGSNAELLELLKSGQDVIVDCRMRNGLPQSVEAARDSVSNAEAAIEVIRAPQAPINWGRGETPSGVVQGELGATRASEKELKLRGRAILLVSGTARSNLESQALFLKIQLGTAARIVGLPTCGTISPVSDVLIPEGAPDGAWWAWPVTPAIGIADGKMIQFRGVPLDREVRLAELSAFFGDPDPLMAWALLHFDSIWLKPRKGVHPK